MQDMAEQANETLLPAALDFNKPQAAGEAVRALIAKLKEQHAPDAPAFRTGLIKGGRDIIARVRESAEQQLLEQRKGLACAAFLSDAQDAFLQALFDFITTDLYPLSNPTSSERLSMVATGGYGRGTLAPGSDIDLLFLFPFRQTAWGEQVVEYLLYLLWDLKFKVGHATRSLDDCIRLAREDHTILTALMEARHLAGDEALFDEFRRRFKAEVIGREPQKYIAEKLAERDERHRRHGESRYLVEPDVKEGKGGLRDLQTLFWIGKYVYGVDDVAGLVAHGVFTKEELRRFLKAEDFFWAVRCHLHFLSGRPTDKLTFDLQPKVAERLGFRSAHARLKHVERFMRRYFLHAKEVGDLTRIFSAVLEEQQLKKPRQISRLLDRLLRHPRSRRLKDYPGFVIETGRIDVEDEEMFRRDPVNMLRLFALADRLGADIHPNALRLVRRSIRLINDEVRNDPAANELFLQLLCDSKDPELALRRLNEADVLGRFIPDFGRIVALMQFNMYHHYTVDEHLIRTVGWLAKIDRGELQEEHPLSVAIMPKVKMRRALYVAAFLHDIAKGRPESHSVAGEKVARKLCPRLGLSEAETEMVAWLVRHHLLMSEVAQTRDLTDFKTILDFAEQVRSPERLRLLLILTVVDIRAVGPGVWNGWKGELLRTLYYETEPVLSGGHATIPRQQRIAQAQARFAEAIGWPEEKLKAYLERHYEAYWMGTDLEHQVRHARLIERAERQGEKIALDFHTDKFTAVTEITVYTPDYPHLLAMLAGACAAAGANITGAKIFTTADGWALDTVIIQRAFDEDADEERRAQRIGEMIVKALTGELRLTQVLAGKRKTPEKYKPFRVAPHVVIDNTSSNRFTIIEVEGLDRIGLLYDLTTTLYALNLNVASAHVTTYGERAVDVFYVTDLTGGKITSEERQKQIRERLQAVLSAESESAVQAIA
jgi:[protein-PII] uridylyltransferase